jgi:hypothetical protein
MSGEDLNLEVSRQALHSCSDAISVFIHRHGRPVEPGGVLLGAFDGHTAWVDELLLDEEARSTATSIELSPSVFTLAEERAAEWNREGRNTRYVMGTWHGHPPGHDTYSGTDARTLFQDQMRVWTDDPSMAIVPWVHLILTSYGLSPTQPHAFSMQLTPVYKLRPVPLEDAKLLTDRLSPLRDHNDSLGLLVATSRGVEPELAPYRPEVFERHQRGELIVVGMWRRYAFRSIAHQFEKLFLENFCQKTRQDHFWYIRLLQSATNEVAASLFECERTSLEWEPSGIVRFTELELSLADREAR